MLYQIGRSRRIDGGAVDAAFGRCYDRLVAWCRRHVRRGLGEPEDFVHQAYLRSRRCWAEERRSPGREEAYFFRALRWVVADAARRRARERRWLAAYRPAGRGPAEGPVGGVSVREALETALTPRERAVCDGFIGGRSERQLCAGLGLTPAAIAVHACRARGKLRRFLGLPAADEPPDRAG